MSTISPNRLRNIKEQLNNGKIHYGQWTWSLDTTWMDDELMTDWLMDGCFPLFNLLTYFMQSELARRVVTFPEKFRKISRILFFQKSYNPSLQSTVENWQWRWCSNWLWQTVPNRSSSRREGTVANGSMTGARSNEHWRRGDVLEECMQSSTCIEVLKYSL